ncbi:MAG: methyltransferase domain-containing protein [Myxococcales bacterium]|nr:methyltransferase domain-containing protein [Myxococcales bacterium]
MRFVNALKQRGKDVLEPWPLAKALGYVAHDAWWGLRLRAGWIEQGGVTVHGTLEVEQSVDVVELILDDYRRAAGCERFTGRVAEIGPGDSAGVALLMRHLGAAAVDLIDRFHSRRDPEQQAAIYQALSRKYGLEALRTKATWDEDGIDGVEWRVGRSAEAFFADCATRRGRIYDLVVSRHVMEHLYDPLTGLRDMLRCTKPGGRVAHQVGFHDHGMFTPRHHALTFLEIPEVLYRHMTANSGRPNRVLTHWFRRCLDDLVAAGAIDYTLDVTHLVDVGRLGRAQAWEEIDPALREQALAFVDRHRAAFAPEFAGVPSRDIAITGIAFVATVH